MWSPTTISFWQWTDGGSSVTLYDNGEIVNQPCWWFADEREISDIVYIEKPQSDAQDDTQTEV